MQTLTMLELNHVSGGFDQTENPTEPPKMPGDTGLPGQQASILPSVGRILAPIVLEIAVTAAMNLLSNSDDKSEGSTYENSKKGITVECAGEKMKVRDGGDSVDCG